VSAPTQNWQDVFFTSRDGLRLYARHYAAAGSTRRPAVCLAGLTRNSRDFHELATHLADPANPAARDVWAIDYRGRGRSAHDPKWQNYTLQIELLDVLDLMTLAGLHDAAMIGTSRGGLLAMILGAVRPTVLGVVVLNDIGPVIERTGLLRIVAYVGRIPLPATWDEATALVRDLNSRQFPGVPEHQWEDVARQWFNDDHGRPTNAYDQNLGRSMSLLDSEVPTLWPQFESITKLPTLVLRGEHSDILSEATVREMRLRHPKLEAITVPGQGHAPLLRDRQTIAAVADFLATTDPAPAT
jgi:pimeloyl-ACP methyl ester carboxylesterase